MNQEVSTEIVFSVNGEVRRVGAWARDLTLSQYLRQHASLRSVKEGCQSGGCGSCSVLLLSSAEKQKDLIVVNACLRSLPSVHGTHVFTTEALPQLDSRLGLQGQQQQPLHPIQARLLQYHATQCGFCTPGIVMSAYAALDPRATSPTESVEADEQRLERALVGNLCRCTGYRPVLDAVKSLAMDRREAFCSSRDDPALVDVEDLASLCARRSCVHSSSTSTSASASASSAAASFSSASASASSTSTPSASSLFWGFCF